MLRGVGGGDTAEGGLQGGCGQGRRGWDVKRQAVANRLF